MITGVTTTRVRCYVPGWTKFWDWMNKFIGFKISFFSRNRLKIRPERGQPSLKMLSRRPKQGNFLNLTQRPRCAVAHHEFTPLQPENPYKMFNIRIVTDLISDFYGENDIFLLLRAGKEGKSLSDDMTKNRAAGFPRNIRLLAESDVLSNFTGRVFSCLFWAPRTFHWDKTHKYWLNECWR